jgi:hypothetical protein
MRLSLDLVRRSPAVGGIGSGPTTFNEGVFLPTEAVIPSYMNPIYRFKSGDGELQLKSNGAAFTLWDALATLDDEAFPIMVEDQSISLQDALQRAASLLEEDPQRATEAGASEETIRKVRSRCAGAEVAP